MPNICNRRWLKSYLPADLIGETTPSAAIITQNQKFRAANNVIEKIAELLSEKPMPLYETYMDSMKECLAAIENNQLFSVETITGNGANNTGSEEPENGNLIVVFIARIHLFHCK